MLRFSTGKLRKKKACFQAIRNLVFFSNCSNWENFVGKIGEPTYPVHDIKPPIHQCTTFIHFLFSAKFLYWNQPTYFWILKVPQNAFYSIIKNILTKNFAKKYSWFDVTNKIEERSMSVIVWERGKPTIHYLDWNLIP